MPKDDREKEAWAKALEMAASGKFKRASQVEDTLRAEGYFREVNAWRDSWNHDRLEQLCRDSVDAQRP